MLFEPIPKRLLIHEVTYTEPSNVGDGSMGGGSKPKSTVIKNVRFTPTRKKVTKSDNTEAYTNGILFIDSVNSSPFIEINEGGKILFKNKKLNIIGCLEAYTDQGTPHHLEVQLQ
ncbi:hypothetical protein ML8HA_00678 [Lactococcus lactis]|nr:hypothetical protein [Lactococcus lactis]